MVNQGAQRDPVQEYLFAKQNGLELVANDMLAKNPWIVTELMARQQVNAQSDEQILRKFEGPGAAPPASPNNPARIDFGAMGGLRTDPVLDRLDQGIADQRLINQGGRPAWAGPPEQPQIAAPMNPFVQRAVLAGMDPALAQRLSAQNDQQMGQMDPRLRELLGGGGGGPQAAAPMGGPPQPAGPSPQLLAQAQAMGNRFGETAQHFGPLTGDPKQQLRMPSNGQMDYGKFIETQRALAQAQNPGGPAHGVTIPRLQNTSPTFTDPRTGNAFEGTDQMSAAEQARRYALQNANQRSDARKMRTELNPAVQRGRIARELQQNGPLPFMMQQLAQGGGGGGNPMMQAFMAQQMGVQPGMMDAFGKMQQAQQELMMAQDPLMIAARMAPQMPGVDIRELVNTIRQIQQGGGGMQQEDPMVGVAKEVIALKGDFETFRNRAKAIRMDMSDEEIAKIWQSITGEIPPDPNAPGLMDRFGGWMRGAAGIGAPGWLPPGFGAPGGGR